MKGKFTVMKLIGVILAGVGLLFAILGAILGTMKYKIKPSDARNSVVWIYEYLQVPELKYEGAWSGTGWAIGEPGKDVKYIITNGHVVEQAYAWPKGKDDPFDIEAQKGFSLDTYLKQQYGVSLSQLKMKHEIRVYFSQSSNDYVVPEVVYYSGPSEKDIAILKLDEATNKRRALLIKDSDKVEVGDEVTALGFPGVSDKVQDPGTINHSIDDVTVTKGIISKRVKPSGTEYDSFQMDVAINHGNSGGPLVDKNGYVVGINTLGNNLDSNMNYAIVSNELTKILDAEKISYKSTALKAPALLSLLVIGLLMIAGGAVLFFVPFGGKKAPAAGTVAPQAGVQPGANPYAQAAAQPAAQGYAQQGAAAGVQAGAAAGQIGKTVAVQASQRPILKGLKGQFAGKSFDLSRGAVVFGRDPASCNLVFNKETPGISSRHCQIVYDAASGSFVLTDLGSSYGTYLANGKKLEANKPERLAAGDAFCLADENVKFQISKE
jgi:S1-C subfamily serine protease